MSNKRKADNYNGSNKAAKKGGGGSLSDSSSSAIPIFLKKTYRMIESCDPTLCSWSEDGDMFIVKNPDKFSSDIIPQYFDHNKFSSFARQLNFYGFRKIQTKPIRNEDFDQATAKHVTFYNEKFKRGRYDLLKEIQRSTRGGGNAGDQAREVESLRETVSTLEKRVQELESRWQEIGMKMHQEIQSKVEFAMMDMLSGRQHSLQGQYNGMGGMPSLPTSTSFGGDLGRTSFGLIGRNASLDGALSGPQAVRAFSMGSKGSGVGGDAAAATSAATLPPHPKQKILPPPIPNGAVARAASGGGLPSLAEIRAASGGAALTSMFEIQAASGGLAASGLTTNLRTASVGLPGGGLPNMANMASMANMIPGGLSNMPNLANINMASMGLNPANMNMNMDSSAAAQLLRNAWEDKFFNTLVVEGPEAASRVSRAASLAGCEMPGANLATLAAARQLQARKAGDAAAFLQAHQAQRAAGLSAGRFEALAPTEDAAEEALKRQTTAEILLEAAGEINAKDKKVKKAKVVGGDETRQV